MNRPFIILCSLILVFTRVDAQVAVPGQPLPAWQPGLLDIHHINTGRGNAAFFILPDSTTLLVDAGELSPLDERTFTQRNAPIRPNDSKKPFEWIVHYIRQVSPVKQIDYALLTHFHDDHFGAWYPDAPASAAGNYKLTGITGVGSLIPINILLDRGNPGYNYPYDMRRFAKSYGGGEIAFDQTMNNYFKFLDERIERGAINASFKAGSRNQMALLHQPKNFSDCYIQNLKSGADIWTGKDSSAASHFPEIDTANRKTWPDENSLSLAFLLHYGPFTYYTGGDNPGNLFPGDSPLRDVETPLAAVTGEVDVAVMDHHGNRDAINENQVKTLKPRVWIGQTWSSDHPGHEVLVRMTSAYLYPGPRDLFATNMLEANRLVIGSLIDKAYKSQQGHILVRVSPGGSEYHIIILDDTRPGLIVRSVFGPYSSKKLNYRTTK